MEVSEKFVDFEEYCKRCVYYNTDENDANSPCGECLACPINIGSHKPINFKEDI